MKYTIIPITALVLSIGYYVFTKPMAVRMALPVRAVLSMDEFYQDAGFLPDFIHCVRAEVTEPEFSSFTTRMKLVPYKGSDSFPRCDANWWSASGSASGAFYDPAQREGDTLMVKYENGRLYYVAYAS
ncbi:hypothetical protein [Nevskia ramosa]|uniref:hypothetical protein n=1 Tax=Nevskia ramosa TaxID=64002 RepID=UPI003D0F7F03